MALSYIRKLYRVESNIADKTDEERLKARQEISVPVLNEFKQWLDKNAGKVMKGGALRKAIDYTLNQWQYLIGYCERGDLMISNIMAENAIRPFAIGRNYPHPIIMQGCFAIYGVLCGGARAEVCIISKTLQEFKDRVGGVIALMLGCRRNDGGKCSLLHG